MSDKVLIFLCCCLCIIRLLQGNQFSPHLFPSKGPFFEGWYMRVTDFKQKLTVGLLFGHVLPATNVSTHPLVLASVLVSESCEKCQLQTYDGFFSPAQLNLTVNGKPVVKNPDFTSPAHFSWSLGKNITFQVQGNRTDFFFQIGDTTFSGHVSSPFPWGPDGEGPEGWLELLPLPLHWFVYSLHSHVSFKLTFPEGKQISSTGLAHLEKNWGKSFPPAWIWAEGVTPSTNVTFSLSGGLVTFDTVSVTAYLIGYRNPSKGLVINFKPTDSVVEVLHEGCDGFVNISAKGLEHQLFAHIYSHPAAFSDCLYGPEIGGFRRACVESYNAIADITIRRFSQTIDQQVIRNYALEFGGRYVCKDKCSGAKI